MQVVLARQQHDVAGLGESEGSVGHRAARRDAGDDIDRYQVLAESRIAVEDSELDERNPVQPDPVTGSGQPIGAPDADVRLPRLCGATP